MPAPKEVTELVDRFNRNYYSYKASQYNETQLRREFIDPLFEALGWDVNNTRGYAEAYKEIIHEDSLRIDGAPRSPDYSFRIGGFRKFFLETKKPSVNLKDDPSPAFQLRRYAWSAKLPISILTDFEEFVVYDTRIKPKVGDSAAISRIDYLKGDDLLKHWDERIAGRFSRDAVLRGDFDRFAGPTGKKRGTEEVDEAFLKQMEGWRSALARILALRNPELTIQELNYAVQVTIDRIVFLRIAEDRGIEEQGRLLEIARTKDSYSGLLDAFRLADDRYNSGLFHFRAERGRGHVDDLTTKLRIDDKTIRDVVEALYYPKSPYEFSVLPADILGQVYERFLGSVIRLTPAHQAVIEPKPEVRKAGGVYYTPTFVVRHIVARAVGAQLNGKSPRQLQNFRVLDPACGSGSFLLEAYQHLLDWHQRWYLDNGGEKWARTKEPRLRPGANGWQLTTAERKRILVAHIYGVDIDLQAVEVTKLSLLLKVLEGETSQSVDQMNLLHDRALPDLDRNIKRGNSLISNDFFTNQYELMEDEGSAVHPFDWAEEFPTIFKDGGLDAVIGNPPYVLLQDQVRNNEQLQYFRDKYEVAAYKIDTYHLFIERALTLAKPNGLVSMITPSNFLTNNHLAPLRRMLLKRAKPVELMVIDGGVFPGISVDNAIFTLQAGKAAGKEVHVTYARTDRTEFEITSKESIQTKSALADPHVLFTGSVGEQKGGLWKKIAEKSVELGSLAYVNFGKQLRDRKKFTRDVISIDSLRDVPRGYRPCYTGKDVGRYSVVWSGLACLNREEARKGGCWDPDKQDAKNKLLTKQIGRVPEFGFDSAGHQCLNTMFMVNPKPDSIDAHVLLACLNSRIAQAVWLDKYYDRRRTFPKIKGTYLKKLPIFAFDDSNSEHRAAIKRIGELARKAATLRTTLAKARHAQERERMERTAMTVDRAIDAEFYQLYDLSLPERLEIGRLATVPAK